jgi:hypothetical protein
MNKINLILNNKIFLEVNDGYGDAIWRSDVDELPWGLWNANVLIRTIRQDGHADVGDAPYVLSSRP